MAEFDMCMEQSQKVRVVVGGDVQGGAQDNHSLLVRLQGVMIHNQEKFSPSAALESVLGNAVALALRAC